MSDRQELHKVLACTSLPSLPTVGVQVLALTRNPDAGMDQIARVIETDPALSAKVLKTVNSSVYGLKQPCTTIRRALGYLGLAAVKSIVLGFSLVDSTRSIQGGSGSGGSNAGFDINDHWRRSMFGAVAARAIAQAVGKCDPEEAFAAALFQDLGALAMFVALGEQYSRVLAPAPADHASHAQLERDALGFTHCECGAALAAKWRLPDRYVQIILHHHAPEHAEPETRDLVRVVGLGTLFAAALTSTAPTSDLASLLAAGKQWFHLNSQQMAALLAQSGQAASEMARLFGKPIGEPPDPKALLQQASEQLVNEQLAAMREAEVLRQKNEALLRQTITDALTGIGNRKHFNDELARLFADARTIGRSFALAICDGDRFKSVNDGHGHHVGDAVLRELARRIRDTAGAAGIACRYGGEEFAILLPGATLAEAVATAEAVRRAVSAGEFDLSTIPNAPPRLPITISIGVAACEPAAGIDFASAELMLEAADKALYSAKHTGRNRVCSDRAPETGPAATADAPRPAIHASPAAAAHHRSGAPHHVLLFEDDPLAARMLIAILQKVPGVEVEWIRSAAKCLPRLAEAYQNPARIPRAIIADHGLGSTNGLALLASVRKHAATSKLPFAIISASEDPALPRQCLQCGASVFIVKDDVLQHLPAWMNAALADASPAVQAQAA